MTTVLASLDRLEELSVHEGDDGSHSASNSNSNSLSKSRQESSLSDSNALGSNAQSVEAEIIAKRAGKTVLYLKVVVLLILVLAGVIVALAIFFATTNGEEDAFVQVFDADATKVFETFKYNMERKLGAIDKLSVDYTSLAQDAGLSYPTFTMPDFEYRAAGLGALANAPVVVYMPIVQAEDRDEWESYSVENTGWINDGLEFEAEQLMDERRLDEGDYNISSFIFTAHTGEILRQDTPGPYAPVWTHHPLIPSLANLDVNANYTGSLFFNDLHACLTTEKVIIGKVGAFFDFLPVWQYTLGPWFEEGFLAQDDPFSKIFYPVYDTFDSSNRTAVGMICALMNWNTYFQQILPPESSGVDVIVENTCGQSYTYRVKGEIAQLVGEGDLHLETLSEFKRTRSMAALLEASDQDIERYSDIEVNTDYCPFMLTVYPTQELYDEYVTDAGKFYVIGVAVVFLITIVFFLLYDFIVEKRQQRTMRRAVQSRAIVSSLFPAAVRERLFKADDSSAGGGDKVKHDQTKKKLRTFISDAITKDNKPAESKPIADLFPHTTVMFADIAGFTKWSSERDPTHVFTLLQTVYHSFDRIAKKRTVFKVETIGDCYVAVTGLPDPQEDHAVRMAKFAHECKEKFTEVVDKLKQTLGQDTADLAMRFGLHSGPVTAGVLRGEKSRFQLFGNTVNNAAKMEGTGERNKIQASGETADLITAAGKGHWVFLRIDDIAARGGLQTYWVEPQTAAQDVKHHNIMPTRVATSTAVDSSERLIEWNTDLLKRLLKNIVAYRRDMGVKGGAGGFRLNRRTGSIVRDEMVSAIALPRYEKDKAVTRPSTIDLGPEVEKQLRKFVSCIAGLYHDHPFHNFKHASNVCTNANKMMNSITDVDIYARTSDPLTQFAVVFSALVHDADHSGVSNVILMKEKPRLADAYHNKSCAEQNSVDLAWNLLMDREFAQLQETIFCTQEEFTRFRQIVVNIVMSTDIFDKSLNTDRDERWDLAFGAKGKPEDMDPTEHANLRATVTIEFAMQLADIMHTTQHFHSYCRWNERLFEEMYRAFEAGRSRKDPSLDWYEGEFWFFDNCVIPMTYKLQDSKVFGTHGEDMVRNAIDNKKTWARSGGEQVKKLVKKVREVPAVVAGVAPDQPESAPVEEEKEDKKEQQSEVHTGPKKPAIDANKHLVEWNVDLFKRLLRQILAHRMGNGSAEKSDLTALLNSIKEGSSVRNEYAQIISFPFFDKEASKLKVDPDAIELDQNIERQLRDYMVLIADMYNEHAFHNFRHAANVATTTNKYLQRIKDNTLELQVFEPLTQFAIIFSSLVHDVDHPGVPNLQLVEEQGDLAKLYDNKSVAEQNSTELAWSLLMEDEFKDLRYAIFATPDELNRFRQLVVNCVLATDLFDEELIDDRLGRWKLGFDPDCKDEDMTVEDYENLRATVVAEHVMMAADIGHTMQHWHSYKRWNERLFFEYYSNFREGRTLQDPSATWYQEEIKFFDSIVLPLAHRLQRSGVFGLAGDDAVRCAQGNRKDWVIKGGEVVEEMKKRYEDYKSGSLLRRLEKPQGSSPATRIVSAVPSSILEDRGMESGSDSGSAASSGEADFMGESSMGALETEAAQPIMEKVLMPSSYKRLRRARHRFWLVWFVGTLSCSLGLWAMIERASDDDGDTNQVYDSGVDQELMLTSRLDLMTELWKARLLNQIESADWVAASFAAELNPLGWPDFTLSNFDQRILGEYAIFAPYLTDDTSKAEWEAFGTQNLHCVSSGDPGCRLPTNESASVVSIVAKWPEVEESLALRFVSTEPPYLPVWQYGFQNDDLIVNYDLRTHSLLRPTLDAMLQAKCPILSPIIPQDDMILPSFSAVSNVSSTSLLLYPIFDDTYPETLLGALATIIDWEKIFNVTIPDTSDDWRIFLRSNCSDQQSLLWGWSDDGMVETPETTGMLVNNTTWISTVDAAQLVNGKFHDGPCSYSIDVLSLTDDSTTLFDFDEGDNVSGNAAIIAAALGVTIAMYFCCFDLAVRRRDRSLTKEAFRSRNIVSSLFPPQFHARLFQDTEEDLAQTPEFQRMVQAGNGELVEYGSAKAPSKNGDVEEKGLVPEEEKDTTGGAPAASEMLSFEKFQGMLSRQSTSMRNLLDIGGTYTEAPMQKLKSFLNYDTAMPMQSEHSVAPNTIVSTDDPIADLFPEATIMFADIAGFTAWSSAREPAQVFKLLETIYCNFDRQARKMQVFKVETIGDCYVAVTGLPNPQPDHAVIMAKFAKDCMSKMIQLTRKLEVTLGPETADLAMRFGLNSGAVTAGVLRGEKSRFQLFGDTVNFASRMESTGNRNRIQASQSTADLLVVAGKQAWIRAREELIDVKGKGRVQTYWVMPRTTTFSRGGSTRSNGSGSRSLTSSRSFASFGDSNHEPEEDLGVSLKIRPKRSLEMGIRKSSLHGRSGGESLDTSRRTMLTNSQHSQIWTNRNEDDSDLDNDYGDGNRQERLIEWNTEILIGLLKGIVAQRQNKQLASNISLKSSEGDVEEEADIEGAVEHTALEEITEIIPFAAANDGSPESNQIEAENVNLSPVVEEQLQEYVTMIACMYRDNFFHNFEHASHVLMSSQKLLKRVVNANRIRVSGYDKVKTDYTSVIASDPLAQFAIVFSALIHDVDHTGVPNSQLINEKAHIAALYKNKSIAEQNSLDLAWELLLTDEYKDLQKAIFATQEEKNRFRQFVVNVVIATDIFDPDMIRVRNSRFEMAFEDDESEESLSPEERRNLKATIVIEYIMQASDVSHTMQHWHVYQKWNERLFEEMYSAYQVKRGDKDPSLGWYKGELWFFDNYIIPLAKKLKDCKVFGAASDECLQYAIQNRDEWEAKGEEMVRGYVAKHSSSL
eukprot:Nitzschia sp. Nitz4//scaffold37_size175936//139425//149009//NITZ4_002062-RA/size175936-snap-gene-0.260-mRNA-1//-1//CDS//3329549836//9160//frame0